MTQFPWVSPTYRGDIHVIKLVCFSLVNLSLLQGVGGVSQPRTSKGRGKIIFPPLHQARCDTQQMLVTICTIMMLPELAASPTCLTRARWRQLRGRGTRQGPKCCREARGAERLCRNSSSSWLSILCQALGMKTAIRPAQEARTGEAAR